MQNQEAVAELCEFLQNKGYIPFFISGEAELLASISQQDFSKLILKIQNLSDIHSFDQVWRCSSESSLPDINIFIFLSFDPGFNFLLIATI